MDVFNLLSYINKISLIAFFITTLVVGYQIYILKKEKFKEKTPTIPDFKEKNNLNVVANFTSLPTSLTKKELKTVNYSKLVFLIISLLTIMVVVFIFILIKQNSSSRNQASVTPTIVVSPTPTFKPILTKAPAVRPTVAVSPSPIVSLSPTPAVAVSPSPMVSLLPSPAASSSEALIISLSPSPTEIVLAQTSTCTGQACLTPTQVAITNSKPQTLPETGSIQKGLLIIVVAISTIFFSFWF